jgi:hypothetical protein
LRGSIVECGFAQAHVGAIGGSGRKERKLHGVAGEQRQLENAALVDHLAERGFRGGKQRSVFFNLDSLGDITDGHPKPESDVVFLAADTTAELAQLADIRPQIRPAGAIWVVSRKGQEATIRDVEVMAAAKEAGLVDNKVVSFSPTHTSLRLVIPLALRPRA